MGKYDRGGKWLFPHFGGSFLRLAGVGGIASWRSLQNELVYPAKTPDGLLEVQIAGQPGPDLFVVEITTHPDPEVYEQVRKDALLVLLDRKVLPEVVVVQLAPRGTFRLESSLELTSRCRLTYLALNWRLVRLWEVPASELLAHEDPGVLPWVTLAQLDQPPEEVFRECRRRIEAHGDADVRDRLLAVSWMLGTLRFEDSQLLEIFGGEEAMLKIPALAKFVKEREKAAKTEGKTEGKAEAILSFLEIRFGMLPEDLRSALHALRSADRLDELLKAAALCADLETFRRELAS